LAGCLFSRSSVVLPDISERFVEQILVLDLVFHVNHLAQGLLDLALSGLGVLPAGEPDQANDLVNIIDDTLDDYWRVLPLYL
jgi:hypothetical protein